MSIYDFLYFARLMELGGFIVGLFISMFFFWPKWGA